jgi:hypothetical protein
MSRNILLVSTLIAVLIVPCGAQSPASVLAPASKPRPATAAAPAQRPVANLSQLMKGILYPASNVIFAAQSQNPADVKSAADPAMATNPLASTYGQWQAVENSALAIVEAANLLTITGRKCSSGVDVPLKNPDWPKLVQGLRDAGMKVYKAAQAKSQDDIVATAGDLTEACDSCHGKYREKPGIAERCK